MEDLDLKELFNNLIIWGVIVVVFGSLMTIFLVNQFGSKDININKKIDKKESLVVLVINNKTKNTREIQQVLKENKQKYETINREKERYFNEFLRKVSLTEEDIVEPTVILIEKGKVKSILVEIKDTKELETFLELNQ